MGNFRFTEALPSLTVDKGLIERIENYFKQEVPKILSLNVETKVDFKISITDDFGVESIDSIELYKEPKFPDDTSEIIISYTIRKPKVKVLLRLNQGAEHSKISIEVESDNARESTASLLEGILRTIRANKNWVNNWFYPASWLDGTLRVSAFVSGLATLNYYPDYPRRMIVLLFITIAIILYFSLGRTIHPYTSFDSNRSDRYQGYSKLFFGSLFTFFVFDIIAIFFIKTWFNF